MNTQDLLDPGRWAEMTFGGVLLKDMRRTRRAVTAATHMAKDASASLPAHMQERKEVKAVYRLLDEPDVTFEELMQPHYQQTRSQMETLPVVLLLQETTDLDYTLCPAICSPSGETRAQRRKRSKETDVWSRCVQAIGPSCSSTLFVHVVDRGADIFEFLDSCRRTRTHFVVRATQDRRVQM